MGTITDVYWEYYSMTTRRVLGYTGSITILLVAYLHTALVLAVILLVHRLRNRSS